MTNAYLEMKNKHQKEVNEFPMFFAFSDKQFEEGMQKFGLQVTDTDQIVSIGGGGFCRKSDAKSYSDLLKRFEQEMTEAMESDETGEAFILDMFSYELANHEYGYTGEVGDTLRALGMTMREVERKPALKNGLATAKKIVMSA